MNPSYRIAASVGNNEIKLVSTISYSTYSYQEGLSTFLIILAIASVLSVISIVIAYIIGIRKRDICSVLVTNIMLKTIVGGILKILEWLYLENTFIVLALAIVTIISEGLIYNKILKYKKHEGITVSIICNIGIIIGFILLSIIIGIPQNLIWIRGSRGI